MFSTRLRPSALPAALAAAALLALPARGAAQHEHHPAPPSSPPPAAARAEFSASEAKEREEVDVRVRLTDSAGRPLTGLAPMAWVDVRRGPERTAPDVCRAKVGSFVEASLHFKHGEINVARPVDDLNGHFVVALARAPRVVVIDPEKGFGRTKLFTAVPLPAPGVDWAGTPDDRRLFVAMPAAGAVAVVDTRSWRVEATIPTGPRPSRAAIDPAGRRVWVLGDSAGAARVTVVDAEALTVAATLPVGEGPHAVAFSDDGRFAFVAARGAGTVAVYDAREPRRLAELKVGAEPADVAWSAARNAAFVAVEGDGVVAVVDPATLAVAERIPFAPGVRTIRFAPDPAAHGGHGGHGAHGPAAPGGKLAFVLNPRAGTLTIYDVLSRQVIRTLSGAAEPDAVAFTASFAYVRAASTPSVAMIPLADPTKGAIGPHETFAAGLQAPGAAAALAPGGIMATIPGGHDALYVANPTERMIYSFHYMEGMPVPHGGLTTYAFEPTAIRTVSRRLRETEPGVYAATVRLEHAGPYELVLRVPEPLVIDCHPFTVAPDPALRPAHAVRIEAADSVRALPVGPAKVRFRVSDLRERAPVDGLQDFQVQLAATGGWQQRSLARPLGGGIYEAEFDVPRAGLYVAAFRIPSRGVDWNEGAPLSFRARP